jgi:LAO/AO transport system kinase
MSRLVQQISAGDMRALATAMTLIENGDPEGERLLKAVYPLTGKAHIIGVTGAAGTGKSTLIDRATSEYRRRKKSVGILAVDPSSMFSEGALLGDRIRMRAHFGDPGVFIRSFATRGGGGGLSPAIRDAIHLLDAAGKDIIFVETIGVGQDELEIAGLVHAVVALVIPEMGDDVQAMKAGLAEIVDIFVVNKADLPGADITLQELRALFCDLDILACSAVNGDGIAQLVDMIEERRIRSLSNGEYQKKQLQLCRKELLNLLGRRLLKRLAQRIGDDALALTAKRVAERRVDPYTEAEELAKRLGFAEEKPEYIAQRRKGAKF